jgi:hypothetical protein
VAFEATLSTNILNWLLRNIAMPAPPREIWIGLHSGSTPTNGNEVTASVGGRLMVDPSFFANAPTPVPGVNATEVVNTKAISFGTATVALNVFTFTLWTSSTGSTPAELLMSGDIIPDVALRVGDPALFSVGDFIVRAG